MPEEDLPKITEESTPFSRRKISHNREPSTLVIEMPHYPLPPLFDGLSVTKMGLFSAFRAGHSTDMELDMPRLWKL